MKNYHLSKSKNNWVLKAEKSERATKVFESTKEKAVKESAKLLKNLSDPASLKIHKENGRIQEERTYPRKSDPKSSKG